MSARGGRLRAASATGVAAMLACVLAACTTAGGGAAANAHTSTNTNPTATDTGAGAGVLTVVSLNLYHDRADWPARRAGVVEGLRALDADVIALQEVLQHETLPNQARDIADALGWRVHFVSVDPEHAPRRYGNAILTRLPVLAADGAPLPPREDGRTVAKLRVELDGRPLDVYATHLHHTVEGGAIRGRQLAGLLAWMDAHADGTPRILLGDFNATADAPELAPLLLRFADAWGTLHPGEEPTTLNPAFFAHGARIDHVFAERGQVEVLDARVVLDRADAAGTWPSDHFGLSARLRLLPAAR